jgi:hypothetical protein
MNFSFNIAAIHEASRDLAEHFDANITIAFGDARMRTERSGKTHTAGTDQPLLRFVKNPANAR